MANIEKQIILKELCASDIRSMTMWDHTIIEEWQNIVDSINVLTPKSGTFTPEIADASTGGNVGTASTIDATYNQVGDRVFLDIYLENIDTTGMTAGNVFYIRGLPYNVGNESVGTFLSQSVTLPGTNGSTSYASTSNYLLVLHPVTGTSPTSMKVSDINSGFSDIWISISYQIGD